MMKRTLAAAALAGGALVLPAATAGAVSPSASCVAVITHRFGPPGGNIEYIKSVSPAPGQFVKSVASQEKGSCQLPE